MKLKKVLALLAVFVAVAVLAVCKDDEKKTYTIVFNSNGGTEIIPQEVKEGELVIKPDDPIKDEATFLYWYVSNEDDEYKFDVPVTGDLTLNALYKELSEIKDRIEEDYLALIDNLEISDSMITLPKKGSVNNSNIIWISKSKYVTNSGIVIPMLPDETDDTAILEATFTLEGVSVVKEFEVTLDFAKEVVITNEREVDFVNKTTEYEVNDGTITLYFEENGSVPYVKIESFLKLLEGFIDADLTYDRTVSNMIIITYQYYDEEEDYTYNLVLEINADDNTIVTNDPAFYWAYVSSTATNYSRHIFYDRENENAYFDEGDNVVYDLDDFNMDIVVVNGEIVLPYYICNQLFAGSSYYNVYYNYDKLIGIYALPSKSSSPDEYSAIRTSSKNSQAIPVDLAIHNFNFLAFVFDNFYGLKDINEIDSYYDLLFESKDYFVTTNPSKFEEGIFSFIIEAVDEPHTSYGYPGYYNRKSYDGPTLSYNSFIEGSRVKNFYDLGLISVDKQIAKKWGITVPSNYLFGAYSDPLRPKYWFVDAEKEVVLLSLDDFNTSDIIESNNWDYQVLNEIFKTDVSLNIPNVSQKSKYFYYNNSTKSADIVEVLIKGTNETDFNNYLQALVANGYEQKGSLYQKTNGGYSYMVAVKNDAVYNAMVISMNVSLNDGETNSVSFSDFTTTVFDLIYSDSAVYMEFQLEKISSEAPNLKNVILDLTFNTGGNVGALYRVLGFITEDPFAVSRIDGDTNGVSTSYVYVDGVPSYAHLEWSLLTSLATFSAANSMATIFKENNLGLVMGLKTGGGASSITPILLPTGSAFTFSSNSINAYRETTGVETDPYIYHSVEYGVSPDYEIPISLIYDNQTLLNIIREN